MEYTTFDYTKIHIFDKRGHEIPIAWNSNLKIKIENRYKDNAEILYVTTPDGAVNNIYVKDKGGRFDFSAAQGDFNGSFNDDFYRMETVSASFNGSHNDSFTVCVIDGGDFMNDFNDDFCLSAEGDITGTLTTPKDVRKTKVFGQLSNMVSIYPNETFIESVSVPQLRSGEIVFPSTTMSFKLNFDKVSTGLIETESLYILAENNVPLIDIPENIPSGVRDLLINSNTTRKTYVKISDLEQIDEDCRYWCDRYKLMLFVDCKKQKDFRFFRVENDELIWSDRHVFDFHDVRTDENYQGSDDEIVFNPPYRANIGFCGENDGVYEETAYVCLIDTYSTDETTGEPSIHIIGTMNLNAEAVGEDERYRALYSNFGLPHPTEYPSVFKDTDLKEDMVDYIKLNKHMKEIFLSYQEIFPYVGTYKALINSIKVLGYDDIFFKEWYRELNDTTGATRYSAFDIDYKSGGNSNIISSKPIEDRIALKKLNWISMMYHMNEEQLELGTDKYGFPFIKTLNEYSGTDGLVKLISLKKWLEKYIIPINCRIIDIGGEGIYFERYKTDTFGGYQTLLEYDEEHNVISRFVHTDRDVIEDGSANLHIKIGGYDANTELSEFETTTFESLCTGYIYQNGYYFDIDGFQTDDCVFVGSTFSNIRMLQSYSAKCFTNVTSFTFDESFFDSSSPTMQIVDGRIFQTPCDLISKDRNSAFVKRPILQIEKGIIRSMDDGQVGDILYIIDRYTDDDSEASYFIKNTATGETFDYVDYITLTPPKYEDSENSVLIKSIPKNGTPSTFTIQKSKAFGAKYTQNNTTYGFRFGNNNPSNVPMFMMIGYQTSVFDTFVLPCKEMQIEILDGKMIFDDADTNRTIFINFTESGSVRPIIDANITYYSEDWYPYTFRYSNGQSETDFHNFINGSNYISFLSEYNTNPDYAVSENDVISIRVVNSGTYTGEVRGRSANGGIFASPCANRSYVGTLTPELSVYTNIPNPIKATDEEIDYINDKFIDRPVFSYTEWGLPILSVQSGDDVSIMYKRLPFIEYNTCNEMKYGSISNVSDEYALSEFSGSSDPETSLIINYNLILKRKSGNRIGMIMNGDDSDIATAGNSDVKYLYANLVVYDTLSDYPMVQIPALIKNSKASGESDDTIYTAKIEDNLGMCYVYSSESCGLNDIVVGYIENREVGYVFDSSFASYGVASQLPMSTDDSSIPPVCVLESLMSDRNLTFHIVPNNMYPIEFISYNEESDTTELKYTGKYKHIPAGTVIKIVIINKSNGLCGSASYKVVNSSAEFVTIAGHPSKPDISTYDMYISTANEAMLRYDVNGVVSEHSNDSIAATAYIESTPMNRRISNYIDGLFSVKFREYDTANGLHFWMNSTFDRNEMKYIGEIFSGDDIYKSNRHVRLSEELNSVCVSVNQQDEPESVMWKVYKRVGSETSEYLFESFTKCLYLTIDEPGIYDVEVFSFDKYGNVSNLKYNGLIIL